MLDSQNSTLEKHLMFYSVILILKLFWVALWTSFVRTSPIWANEEDVKFFGIKNSKVTDSDDLVNRVKRIHLNDLENIPAFILLGFFYVQTNPSHFVAVNHFRVFAASRLLHTIAYRYAIPQPARGACFTAGLIVCLSMAIQTLIATF